MTRALRRPCLAALAAAAVLPWSAPAQPPQPAPPAPAIQPAADLRQEFLARQITRLALFDLRATDNPTPEYYRLAAILLGIAADLAPKDQEILRRRIEASANAGDTAAVLELSRALLDLDPGDTITQLRLITASISQNAQNADDRIRAYENFLDPKGRGRVLDPSILSRLALDAAMLLRERGDDRGFIDKLTMATRLDPSHKEAQALAATVFAERRPGDALGRVQMLEHLLMADPLDPNVHMSIARELAAGGAYKAAARFQENAVTILDAVAASTEGAYLEALILRWQAEGPGVVAAQLNQDLNAAKDRAQRDARRAKAAGVPQAEIPNPEHVRLPLGLQFLYILANDAAGDRTAVKSAAADLGAQIGMSLGQLNDPNKRGNMTDAQAASAAADLFSQLQTIRVWANIDTDAAKRDLEGSAGLARLNSEADAALKGWLAARTGDPRVGLEALEARADTSVLAAVGVGVAHEALGQIDQAKAAYARVLRARSTELAGAWSRSRLLALGVLDDPARSRALEEAASRIPGWVDKMATSPREFVQLQATLANLTPDALDRAAVHLVLQNISTIPLSLGPDRPLNSRLLFAPKLEVFGAGALALARPEIVDIDRRLRLKPQERLTVTVWPDAGESGWLMELMANRSIRIRWRIIQGFLGDPRGGFRPGAMCVTAETEEAVRRPIPETSLPPEAMARKIAGDPASALVRLAAAARTLIMQPLLSPPGAPAAPAGPGAAPAPPAPSLKPIADAFAARYAALDPIDRAILIVTLPHAQLAPVMSPFDQAARADADPLIQTLLLVTRVTAADDPVLVKAKDADDPRLKQAAAMVAQRLADKARSYASLTAGDLAPPAPAGPAK